MRLSHDELSTTPADARRSWLAHLPHGAALALTLGFCAASARAQQVDVTVRIDLDRDFQRATQIVIPQSRGFWVDPHRHGGGVGAAHAQAAVQVERVAARVDILERAATTILEIHLRNPGGQQVEAVLLLPVPDDAVVSSFLFEGASSEPTAQVLPRDEARRLYDSIVAKVRDPALLEFAGYNLIRSSVFPVAAGGTQKVRLTYENILGGNGNRIDYVLPRTEALDRSSPWSVIMDVRAQRPISTAYSPSHEIITERPAPERMRVKLADAAAMEPGSFMLSYLLEGGPQGVSASFFAYPDPKVGNGGAGDSGYFLMMAGLPASIDNAAPQRQRREVTIVIDRSGSMAGAKMDQAKAAALQVIEGLAPGEAFNIIDYSTTVAALADAPLVKDEETTLRARAYLTSMRSGGGTNIHDALVEALQQKRSSDEMLPITLFLTDGLPTVGNTSETAIRELVEKGNADGNGGGRRIFTFGVGHDVNVPLLDRIADITRATATYVLPEEDVEVKVAQVFKRLYGPVFKDIRLATSHGENAQGARPVRELIPSKLPDLFEGDQLILLGQYTSESPVTFKLTGDFLGAERTFDFSFGFDTATTKNAFVPRLWASRRIAYLVDQIRQAGAASATSPAVAGANPLSDPRFKELSDEILRLSTEFGILTEYTAFLATEGTDLSDWNALANRCGTTLDDRAVKSRWGIEAVNQGINFNAQKGQTQLKYRNDYVDAGLNAVQITGVQQVCDRAFFKRGAQWIDSQLIAQGENEAQPLQPDLVIQYGSPEHFALLHKLIAQNRQGVLSLDGDIIIHDDGRNILIRNTQPDC